MDYTTGFPGDSDLAAQAISAIHQGADPDAVRKVFLQEAAKRGADPSKINVDFLNDNPDTAKAPSDSKISPATKRAYADVVQGNETDLDVADNATIRDRGVIGLLAPKKQRNSPAGGNFDNVDSGSDTTAPRDWGDIATYQGEGMIKRGLGGLVGLAAPLGSAVGDDVSDKLFEASKKLREYGDKDLAAAVDQTVNGEPRTSARGTSARVVGGLLGGVTMVPLAGEIFNAGADKLDKDESLSEAEKAVAKEGLKSEATLAAGFLGKQAAGVGAYATRAGSQFAANLGLTEVEKKLEQGKDVNIEDVANAAGTALAGGLARNERGGKTSKTETPKAEEPEAELPETKDPAFEAGKNAVDKEDFDFDAAMQRQQEAIAKRTAPEQGDLFSANGKSEPMIGDLFGGEPTTAANAESRWVAERQNPGARTPEQDTSLESNYIQDQQEGLNAQPDVGTEPKSMAELWDVGAKGIVEDKLAQAGDIVNPGRDPNTGLFQHKRFSPANAAMADAFQRAGVRRGLGLEDQSLFPDIRNRGGQEGGEGGTFEPSRNPAVEQTAEQGQLDLGQEDLFNQQAPARREAGMSPFAARKARLAAEAQNAAAKAVTDKAESQPKRPTPKQVFDQRTQAYKMQIAHADRTGNAKAAETLRAKLDSHLKTEKGQTGRYRTEPKAESRPDLNAAISAAEARKIRLNAVMQDRGSAPESLVNSMHEGTLTAKDVIDHVRGDNSYNLEVRGIMDGLAEFEEKLGGGDVKHVRVDANKQSHQEFLERNPGIESDGTLAAYDPHSHTIYHFTDRPSLADLVHETAHAVTERAISAGLEGRLTGEGAKAFHDFKVIFDSVKPFFTKKFGNPQERNAQGRQKVTLNNYGIQDLHEYMAEFYANPHFRTAMKSVKLSDMGMIGKIIGSKVRNMYQATVKAIRGMFGMPPTAESAFDALFSAHENFLNQINAHEATPDPAGRALATKAAAEEELQGPRSAGWKWTKLFLAPKGIEPLVTLADRTREGVVAHGYVEAAQAANRIRKVTTDANRADINKALDGDVGALSRLTGKAATVVKNEMAANADRVIELAKEVAANPKATDKEKAAVMDLLDRAATIKGRITKASVLPKTIFGASFMKQKWDLAQKAEAKLAKGETLNPAEQKVKKDLDDLRDSLEQTWFPKDLTSLKTPELEKLYWYHVGNNPDGMALKGEAKKNAMIAQIGQSIQDTVNKAGAVDNLAKSAMDLTDKNDRMRQYYKALRKKAELGADVPEPLMRVWEQVDEPAARIASNIVAQRSATAEARALNQLREQGLGKIFTEQKGQPGYTHQLTGSRYGALRNLWTTPDVAGVINGAFGRNYLFTKLLDGMVADPTTRHWPMLAAAEVIKGWSTATQYWKMFNVMGKVGRYVLNAAGSFSQAMSNGNASGEAWRKGMMVAIESLGVSAKSKMSPMLADMFKYHQIEYSWIQELKGTENGNIISSILKHAAASNDLAGAFYEGRRKAQLGVQMGKEVYGIQDWWTKAANWYHALDFWAGDGVRNTPELKTLAQKYGAENVKKALIGYDKAVPELRVKMTPEDRTVLDKNAERIKQFVSKRNNDTNITPSLSFPAVRGAEKLVGAYLTYFAEIPRTLGMNAKYGFEDAFRGAWTGDAKMFQHGMDRVLGTVIAFYGISQFGGAMYSAGANMLGLASSELTDDDPRKKYADSDPYLATMSPMVLKDPQHPEAGEYIVDQGAVDPYGPSTVPIWKAVSALQKSQAGDKEGAKQDLEMAYKSLWGMIDRNPVLAATRKIMNGATPRMAETNPDEYNRIKKWLTDRNFTSQKANSIILMLETASLGSFKDWVAGAGVAQKSPALGTATKAGVGVQPFNVAHDITTYIGGKTVGDITNAKKAYTDLMKQDYTSSPERLEGGFKDALKDIVEPYSHLRKAVQAAKAQGVEQDELVARMKSAGVGKKLMATLLQDQPMTVLQMMADLKDDVKKDIANNYTDPTKRQEAVARYQYNTEQLMSLLRKYRDVNLEEIE